MEGQRLLLFAIIIAAVSLVCRKLFLKTRASRCLRLPPQPPKKLPLIGHLYLLKPPIHRTFQSLALRHGPVFALHLGSRLVYVVSSLTAVQECFTKNDVVLANRPRFLVNEHVGYGCSTMVSAPYGEYWRNLRRIGTLEIFSSHRLNGFLPIRRDEIRRLILRLARKSTKSFAKVDMRAMLSDLTFNNVMRMLAGKKYYGEDLESDWEAGKARDLISEVAREGGAANLGDYVPIFNWFMGYEKRIKLLANRVDTFLQRLIDEKQHQKEKGNTVVDHLLALRESEPENYPDKTIKGLLLVMIFAGTDTSAVTMEWALTNLLTHPDLMEKAQAEIEDRVGTERLVDESDMADLPYLKSIMNETFRLHPAAPMLLPHTASNECLVAGYDMPKGTTLLVNAWAIHRDPELWDEPEHFKPERFEKDGEAQKLLVFGMGRRVCPGSGLAQRLVALTLASLIQCFEWRKVDDSPLDMTDGKGITTPRAEALEALCMARPIANKLLEAADF